MGEEEEDGRAEISEDIKPRKSVSILELETEGNFPPDTYSFMMLCNPLKDPIGFLFGFAVYAFQIMFLLLLVLNVLYPKWSSYDNSDGSHIFVPGDVEPVVKFCQYLAVLAFALFADDSIMDVITSIDMFPRFSKVTKEDNVFLNLLANFLRATQGGLAIVVSFLLIFTSGNVLDIILNFTAVNFISGMDGQAFELAQKGHYGQKLREDADMIEETELPAYVTEKDFNLLRKNVLLVAFFAIMVGTGGYYSLRQARGLYLTDRLRVEFDNDLFTRYNGCYSSSQTISKSFNGNRLTYEYYDQRHDDKFKFGYCKSDRTWYFYENTNEVGNIACNAIVEDKVLAYSSSTNAFDIGDTFTNPWFSGGGSPLTLNFIQKEWLDEECAEFFADGICYEGFNSLDFEYDGGDCCGATCPVKAVCGVQKLENAFGLQLKSLADGFQTCVDPDMVDIVIKINGIKEETKKDQYGEEFLTLPPLLILDCDDKNHMLLKLENAMVGKSETVKVSDGASCKITVRYEGDLSETDYQIHHRLETGEEILVLEGNNKKSITRDFKIAPKCFFKKLSDHLDVSAIYNLKNTPSHAVNWLLKDETGNSDCENIFFIERYALTVMNMEAKAQNNTQNDGLWIETTRQCNWPNIICNGGYIEEIFMNSYNVSGNIATEIGLLPKLINFDSNYMSYTGTIPTEIGKLSYLRTLYLRGYAQTRSFFLSGTIPSELGKLKNLTDLLISSNGLSGTIPTEMGGMSKLRYMDMFDNELTGEIPSELGNLPKIILIAVNGNKLNGTIPTELGGMSTLKYLQLLDNSFNSTLPSELGNLASLVEFDIRRNAFYDTIPTTFGNLANLKKLLFETNAISGTIPTELGKLSKLEELEGFVTELSGTIPTELGNLAELKTLGFVNTRLNSTLPTELGKLEKLQKLLFPFNGGIHGPIPTEIGNMKELEYVDLRSNQINGTIPTQMSNLIKLSRLLLSKNQLTGSIPTELATNVDLAYILLDNNALEGSIPKELANLELLRWLHLHFNSLSGIVPPEMVNLLDYAIDHGNFRIYGNDLSGMTCGNETEFVEADFDCGCCHPVPSYYYYYDGDTDDYDGDTDDDGEYSDDNANSTDDTS